MREFIQKIQIQPLPDFSKGDIQVDVLRLDLLHPVVSGNKWFKLQQYIADALATGKDTIATFGGAYSNHIVATAYAAREMGLKSIGYIRGEKAGGLNQTLLQAATHGMELRFVTREGYKDKASIIQNNQAQNLYWIMEGGYGPKGAAGAAGILKQTDTRAYTHILCAVGTGTTMAGLILGAEQGQHITGISVLKNHFSLGSELISLLGDLKTSESFSLLHDYHFGGYAKHPPELLDFMKQLWYSHQLPTDIVYTSKLFFAVQDLLAKDHFLTGSRLLVVHSGGLQGNHSLPAGTLPF